MTPSERTASVQRRVARFRELADRLFACTLTEHEFAELRLLSMFLSLASRLDELPADTFAPDFFDKLSAALKTWVKATRMELVEARKTEVRTWN